MTHGHGCRNLQNKYILLIKNSNQKFILWTVNCFKFSFIEKKTNKKEFLMLLISAYVNKKEPIIIKCMQSHYYLNDSQSC